MTSIRQEIRRITQQGRGPFSCMVTVDEVRPVSNGFRRVAVRGDGLADYREVHPADAFKLMLPPRGHDRVDFPERDERGMPYWPEGTQQPLLRAYTVRSFDEQAKRIEFDVAEHSEGPGMDWLDRARPGEVIGLSGMRHEFHAAEGVDHHLIAGDASALPAVAAIVESLPEGTPATVCLTSADESDQALLPEREEVNAHWAIGGPKEALIGLVRSAPVPPGRTQAWLAAEASVVRELRRYVLDELGVQRKDMQARAYWKAGMDSTSVDADNLKRYQHAAETGADITDPDVVDRMEFEANQES